MTKKTIKTKKNKGGRPTKLTKGWLQIAGEVLTEDMTVIIFTDNELREEINDRLSEGLTEKEARKVTISDTTFESWKRQDLKDPIGKEFLRLYKKALRVQKENLFKALKDEPDKWQKYAWLIERKFSEWNLKNIQEVDSVVSYKIVSNEKED